MLAGGFGGDFQSAARDGEEVVCGEDNAVVRVVQREGARRQLVTSGGLTCDTPRRADHLHVLWHALLNDKGDDGIVVTVSFAGTE